jgi:hypothetical protein
MEVVLLGERGHSAHVPHTLGRNLYTETSIIATSYEDLKQKHISIFSLVIKFNDNTVH